MNEQTIKTALATVKGATFATISYTTDIAPSAANKSVSIVKQTKANVQLFNNLNDFSVYERAVKRTANRIDENDKANTESFEVSSTHFEHEPDCFSIVKNKKSDTKYLYVIYNTVYESQYFVNGELADKETVAGYLTPSASKKLMQDNSVVYNKTNDVLHTVIVRTIKLENIDSLKVNGQLLTK